MIGLRMLTSVSFTMLTIACTVSPRANTPYGKAEATLCRLTAPRAVPPKTVVTPYLQYRIEPGVNVVWCATFQMAWDKLKEIEGGDVKTSPDNVTVSKLNRESIVADCLPRLGALSVAGLVRDGVLEDIQARTERLAGAPQAISLPPRGSLAQDAVIMYACLARSLHYAIPFKVLPSRRFGGADGKVVYFGVDEYDPLLDSKKKQGSQIRVLWHRFTPDAGSIMRQEFAIELVTTEKDDRLILAKVSPASTLRETVNMVLRHVEHPNTKKAGEDGVALEEGELRELARAENPDPSRRDSVMQSVSGYCCLLFDEDVRIPRIRIELSKRVDQLIGVNIVSQKEKLDRKPIIVAEQQIRFSLDETGANLESQALMALFGSRGIRDFSFTSPFVLLLMRQGASTPYFAAWIGNSELLVEEAGQAPIAGNLGTPY